MAAIMKTNEKSSASTLVIRHREVPNSKLFLLVSDPFCRLEGWMTNIYLKRRRRDNLLFTATNDFSNNLR